MEKPSLDTAKAGAMRFNTDSSQLEIYDGNQWTGVLATSPEQQTGGTRGLWAGGEAPSKTNVIQFVNIETTGDTVDFGDAIKSGSHRGGFSNSIRGGAAGGFVSPADHNTIEFVNIATTGNGIDWGDMTVTRAYNMGTTSDSHGGLSE